MLILKGQLYEEHFRNSLNESYTPRIVDRFWKFIMSKFYINISSNDLRLKKLGQSYFFSSKYPSTIDAKIELLCRKERDIDLKINSYFLYSVYTQL